MGTHPNGTSDPARGRVIVEGATSAPATAAAGDAGGLRALLESLAPADDQALADLVEADGRERLRLGLGVDLQRYLDAAPGLEQSPCALDAAIELTLRSMAGAGQGEDEAAAELIRRYPALRRAIETSSALSTILLSTRTLVRARVADDLPLPRDFGPRTAQGRARYELRELLGAGAHGLVYLGVDRQLSDPDRPAWVAVKVLRGGAHPSADEGAKARRVDHPNIVRVLDAGSGDSGERYLVYEYIRGRDLGAFVASHSGPVPERQCAALVAAIARGLQAAHAAGLVHCDLKPSNILMTEDRTARIADFGIAVRLRGPHTGRAPLGNLAFAAPEQLRGDAGASAPSADIYAAGGLLYWLLTGRYPNGATREEIEAGARAQERAAADPALVRKLDPDLAAICRRALQARASERYQSAEALATDLELWLGSSQIRWIRYSPWRRARLLVRREPVTAAMAALVLLTVVGAVALAVYISQQASRRILLDQLEQSHQNSLAEHQRMRDAQETARGLLAVFRDMLAEEEFVPAMTAVELMCGPSLFGAGGEPGDIWASRAEVARRILERARQEGREDDLEPMLWETAYGYWLICMDDLQQAQGTLAESRRRWERIKPGDPWISCIGAMQASTEARLALRSAGEARERRLREAAALLESARTDVSFYGQGRLVRRLVLTASAELYGVDGLNQPLKAEEARRELRQLR